jgi:hypothetical protein
MQKRKNIFLLISFFVLTAACVVVYFAVRVDGSLDVDVNLFRVDDFKSIDRVVMSGEARDACGPIFRK